MRFLVPFIAPPALVFRCLRLLRVAVWVGYFMHPSRTLEFVRESHGHDGVCRRYFKCGKYFVVLCTSGTDIAKEAIEVRKGNVVRLRLARKGGGLVYNRLKRLVSV
jgi:hypothetical protein